MENNEFENQKNSSKSVDVESSELIDKKLYKKASRRAGFKIHLGVYMLVNLIFWMIWFFVIKDVDPNPTTAKTLKALLFFSIVWLLLLIGHYLAVYRWNKSLVEKELNNLIKENKRNEENLKKLKQKELNNQQKIT